MPAFYDFNEFNNRTNNNSFNMTTSYDTSTRAVLYIFAPRQVPDYTVRGYCYNFDNNFVAKASELIQSNVNKGLALNNPFGNASMLSKDGIFSKAIAPETCGSLFSGHYFDRNYTFVLIVDNATFEGRYNPTPLSNRLLYCGYFTDEPVTGVGTSRLTFNDKAAMIFTHFTHINIKNTWTNNGLVTVSRPLYDMDIVSPAESLQVSPHREYLSRPYDYATNIKIDAGSGYTYVNDERTWLGNKTLNEQICTKDTDPTTQLNAIFTGLTEAKLTQEYGDLNSFSNLPGVQIQDDYTWVNAVHEKIKPTVIPDKLIGIDINRNMFLGDLLNKYPILHQTTQYIDIPWNLNDSPMENSAPTAINIWSSLLMSTIPSVMSNFGISDAIFRYDSTNFNSTIISAYNEPVYEVFEISSFMPDENTDVTRRRWEQALSYLESIIFPIITNNVGNFSAIIKYSSAKECAVQLNLPDMTSTINDGIIMNNALFGGHQTPMVISSNLKNHNLSEFEGLSQVIQYGTTHSYTSTNSSYGNFNNDYNWSY